MTRDDIYDHLAQVYLGKRKEIEHNTKRQFNAWLVINIFITVIIFASAFYGLTAFLTHQNSFLKNNIIFSLHRGPLRFEYNFKDSFHPVETFKLEVPPMDASKYNRIRFSIRGKEEGYPGVVKVIFKNRKNESAAYYVQGVGLKWQEFDIPLKEFQQITDWTNLSELSFVLESWNVDKKKGVVLIDEVRFSSAPLPG